MSSMRSMMNAEHNGERLARAKEKIIAFGATVLDTVGLPKNEIKRELAKPEWKERFEEMVKSGGEINLPNISNKHVEINAAIVGIPRVGNPSRERPQFHTPTLFIIETFDLKKTQLTYVQKQKHWIIPDIAQKNVLAGLHWYDEKHYVEYEDGETELEQVRSTEGHITSSTLFALLSSLKNLDSE